MGQGPIFSMWLSRILSAPCFLYVVLGRAGASAFSFGVSIPTRRSKKGSQKKYYRHSDLSESDRSGFPVILF